MGRVRPGHIKRAAEKLLEDHPELFSDDFEDNKKVVNKLVMTDSKKIKNRIAGYITSNAKN